MAGVRGFEPLRLTSLESKSSAVTNFATPLDNKTGNCVTLCEKQLNLPNFITKIAETRLYKIFSNTILYATPV